ncbi:hypothetical protein GCM10009557_31010 [Virgisporangium ochraceum]
MHDLDEEQDDLIRLLAPTFQLRTRPDEALLQGIMATACRPARVDPRRRRLVAGVAVTGLAAAVFAVFAVLPFPSPVGGPLPANALSITEDAGYLVITIKDPAADPARYEAEIRRRGLNIRIALVPTRPENVGKVVFSDIGEGGELFYIEAPGRCAAHGSCVVGVKVPLDFTSHARIVFGRAALPGELAEICVVNVDAETTALRGRTVAEARAIAAATGRSLLYNVGGCATGPVDRVPGTWRIYDAAYDGDDNIVIWASADGAAPSPAAPSGSPAPSAPRAPSPPARRARL